MKDCNDKECEAPIYEKPLVAPELPEIDPAVSDLTTDLDELKSSYKDIARWLDSLEKRVTTLEEQVNALSLTVDRLEVFVGSSIPTPNLVFEAIPDEEDTVEGVPAKKLARDITVTADNKITGTLYMATLQTGGSSFVSSHWLPLRLIKTQLPTNAKVQVGFKDVPGSEDNLSDPSATNDFLFQISGQRQKHPLRVYINGKEIYQLDLTELVIEYSVAPEE